MPLNTRQQRVLDFLRAGMDEKSAILQAGYKQPSRAVQHLNDIDAYVAQKNAIVAAARRAAQITRDDVIEGLKTAIHDARLLSDPNAQIKGWSEIGKILGYYAPEKRQITLSTEEQVKRKQLESLPEEELLALADISSLDVIEGEFEPVDN